MRLRFLGTGTSQGVPVIACKCAVCTSVDHRDARLRTSALLSLDPSEVERLGGGASAASTGEPTNILFDIGPDFRQQMLKAGVQHLEAILITHAHRDHVAGLDDVRALNYVQHGSMHLYLNAEARKALERDYRYIFAPHNYPGLPEVELHTEEGDAPFVAGGVQVVPIRAMHKDLPILGFRIGNLAYITDANYIAPEELDKLEGVDTLVINALRQVHHFSHYSLPEALQVVQRVGARRAFLTHISHDMGLHAEVQPTLPAHIHLAYDGLEIEI